MFRLPDYEREQYAKVQQALLSSETTQKSTSIVERILQQNGTTSGQNPYADATEYRKQRTAELAASAEIIMSKTDIHMRTVLTSRQIASVVRAMMYAEKYDNDLARFSVLRYLQTKLSEGARSRNDMNELLRATVAMETPGTATPWWKRIIGQGE